MYVSALIAYLGAVGINILDAIWGATVE